MFKLESYITPLLMGYVDKYVKLKQEDFQLSLWGGDAVLNKLDLRLDAIEKAIKLPISFKSGFIHELRIHVPWTKLGSEPVVVTINTIECILKLSDSSNDERESVSSKSSASVKSAAASKPKIKRQETEELPPGYLQSLVNRILNNINIVINNLILKFVEDDIVLSMNVKSAECYSVNGDWTRSFIELTPAELVLRRVVNFHDATLCLDKRNASGKIENYQDPLAYRCSITCRLYMLYDSLHAKLPSSTKLHFLCEKLDLSLTDTQVPMFFRLLELILAIYYGNLETNTSQGVQDAGLDVPESFTAEEVEADDADDDEEEDGEGGDEQGWMGWAWSYMPPLLPTGEGMDGEEYLDEDNRTKKKPEPAVLEIGFYVHKACVMFKLTEIYQDTSAYYASQRLQFKPCMCWEAQGISCQILVRGLTFFNAQFGITSTRVRNEGEAICGVKDTDNPNRDPCFCHSGNFSHAQSAVGYMIGSLFDEASLENQENQSEFIFDADRHVETYTEEFALQKYGAFWMDYLFTMDIPEDEAEEVTSSSASVTEETPGVRETSAMRLLIGPGHLIISSSMQQRIQKFLFCMSNNDYEPYSKPKAEVIDETRAPPTSEEIQALEDYIPTRSMQVTFLKPTITVMAADLPQADVTKRKVISGRRLKKSTKSKPADPAPSYLLPATIIQVDRFDIQSTVAMYPRRVVRQVSKIPAPSHDLLHYCHSHLYVKAFGVQCGLTYLDITGRFGAVQSLMQPCSGAIYLKNILLPAYWKNPLQPRLETMTELPSLSLSMTKAHVLALAYIASSWLQKTPAPAKLADYTLLEDIFGQIGLIAYQKQPILQLTLAMLEVKLMKTQAVISTCGTLSAVQMVCYSTDEGKDVVTPLLYGPVNTTRLHQTQFFTDKSTDPDMDPGGTEVINFTVQFPRDLNDPQAPSILLLDVQGISACLDPLLYDWIMYAPFQKVLGLPFLQPLRNENSPSQASNQTGSNVTEPTDTRSVSQSQTTQTQTDGQPSQTQEDAAKTSRGPDTSLGRTIASFMPLAKMSQIQIDVSSLVVFIPTLHITLPEPTMNIPANLQALYRDSVLPPTLVLSLPQIHVSSLAHKQMAALLDLPIKHTDLSVSSEKLPWSVHMTNFSVYSLQVPQRAFYVVKPSSLSATLAVTTKYSPPVSDNISSLAFCVHSDMNPISAACNNDQIELLYSLIQRISLAANKLLSSLDFFKNVSSNNLSTSMTPSPPNATNPNTCAATAAGPNKSVMIRTTSTASSLLDPVVTDTFATETSDDLLSKDSLPANENEERAKVKLSLWFQWTLPKFMMRMYAVKDSGEDVCVSTEVEDLAVSIDIQEVYSKVECKLGSANVVHYIKRFESQWVLGDHQGVILSCTDKISRNTCIISNKQWSSPGNPIVQLFGNQDQKPHDKNHGFMSLTFTRALQKSVKKKMMRKMAAAIDKQDQAIAGHDSSDSEKFYLNEVCVNIQPCDVVLNCPVIMCAVGIFSMKTTNTIQQQQLKKPIVLSPQKEVNPRDGQSKSPDVPPWLTSAALPLLYVNANNFRLFIPDMASVNIKEVDAGSEIRRGDSGHHESVRGAVSIADSHGRTDRRSSTHTSVEAAHSDAAHSHVDRTSRHSVDGRIAESEVSHKSQGHLSDGGLHEPGAVTVLNQSQKNDTDSAQEQKCDDLQKEAQTERREIKPPQIRKPQNSTNPLEHDMFVMQVIGLTLSPQADNPLPRIVIEKDIYRRALHAGITSLPGSEVEDRQYQLDVCGLGFCTGQWQSVINEATSMENFQEEEKVEVQIPALEWNNFSKVGNEKEVVHLYPLSQCFDMKAVFAPAVIYQPPSTEGLKEKPVLICGHSLEVNATSDMDFSLSTSQIWLMKSIADTNMAPLLNQSSKTNKARLENPDEVSLHDSGVESDQASNSNMNGNHCSSQKNASKTADWLNFTPFDILLTAGKISFMVYSHKNMSIDEFKSTNHNVKSKLTKADLEYKEESSLFNQSTAGNEDGSAVAMVPPVVPYFYAYFAQPHTVLTLQKSHQKLELSCYDVIIKGAKIGHTITDESKLIPDTSDFSVHWIETRPGKPNPKTGIPPSLYTFQITDFLFQPAEVKLKLERPLKVNMSITKVQQVSSLMDEILTLVTKPAVERNNLLSEVVPSPRLTDQSQKGVLSTAKESNPVMSALAYVSTINFYTVQVVVAMETFPHVENAFVMASIKDMDGEVAFKPNNEGVLEEITTSLFVREILMKTSYCGKSRPLIGPFNSSLNMSADWCSHSGPQNMPKILIFLENSILPVYFGQEHALCLTLISQYVLQYLDKLSVKKATPHIESDRKLDTPPAKGKLDVLTPTSDDLRVGTFEYITDDSGAELLPSPFEIMFGVEADDDRPIMTWCYPYPRVLTSVEITPVPLNPPQGCDPVVIEKIKVPCILQYWDTLIRQFVDYTELRVSENESCHVELPTVMGVLPAGNDIVAAQVWRVVILQPKEAECDELGADLGRESLLSPLTLAASMRVDSCFVPALVPAVKMSLSCSMLQLHLQNHVLHLGKKTPDKLLPFTLDNSSPHDQHILVLNLDGPQLYISEPLHSQAWSRAEVSCTAQCDLLEYRNLTMASMLDHTDLQATLTVKRSKEHPSVNCNMNIHPLFVRGGQGIIHTLTMAAKCWKQMGNPDAQTPVMNYYVICNDTHETVKIGQADTDEMIALHSRQCHAYSWRTHKTPQVLAVSVEGLGGQWCEPVDVDHVGITVRVIQHKGHKVTLIIRVKQLTNVQKQIIISGQLVVSSRLNQHLEVKVLTTKMTKDSTAVLSSQQTRPSYVVEHADVRAIKVRLLGMKTTWSQEVAVTGDNIKDSRLIKVPLQEKGSFIHVWCHMFYQNHRTTIQNLDSSGKLSASVRMVVFTPLFVVRTHLPSSLLMNIQTPRLKLSHQIQLEGQGREQQLNILGGDSTHNITFQLGPTMKPSNPAISLSSGMIDQLEKVSIEHPDLYKLCYDWLEDQTPEWPYNSSAKEISFMNQKGDITRIPVPPKPQHSVVMPQVGAVNSGAEYEQPNIDLRVQLEQYWPGCNTVLIDVKPYWLLVNDTGLDLLVVEGNLQQWALPKQKVFAPPPFEATFRVGLLYKGQLHTSDLVQLSEEDVRGRRYMPTTAGVIYAEGFTQITVYIKNSQELDMICFLTLLSTYKDGMRVVTIRETYSLCNNTERDFQMQLYNIPLAEQKVDIDHSIMTNTKILSKQNLADENSGHKSSDLSALLFWNIPEQLQQVSDTPQYLQYMSIRHDTENTSDSNQWSHPIRTEYSERGQRSSVSVPIRTKQMEEAGEGYDCRAYVITGHSVDGIVYLVLEEDPNPDVVLYNRCDFTLLYGQTYLEDGIVFTDDAEIQEEAELVTSIPTVMPFSRASYTFPAVNTTFPELPSHSFIPKLHLAGNLVNQDDEQLIPVKRVWSYGIDLASEHDSFISIPELSDVKVHIERVGYTFHIHIDPVSRAEISAREIRSRIKGKETTVVIDTPKKQQQKEMLVKPASRRNSIAQSAEVSQTAPINKFPSSNQSKISNIMQLKLSLLCHHASVTLLDETTDVTTVKEILRVSIDNAFVAYYPLISPETLMDMRPSVKQLLTIYCGDLQIDNQMHSLGCYDFPVVLLKQSHVTIEPLPKKFTELSLSEKLECLQDKGLIQVTCTLCKDLSSDAVTLQNVDVGVRPISVFIEDMFVYDILKKIDSFIATRLSKSAPDPRKSRCLPKAVRCTSQTLSCPIRLESLSIRQLSLLLSVHASLKLFIASDNTPLTLGTFERQAVFTTVPQLTKALAMHYASGALFRAGWVVGSLEILGNPTGLVRNIGTGIGDMFRMPYEGITRGPGAFIRGVSQGMGSLLKHVSTGTLTSITSFASSVSRNMDKLSLDTDHCIRQEVSRRHRPDGLGAGLKQGLTGFGLSLLGAVAGLADQPLQGFLTHFSDYDAEDEDGQPIAQSNAASGIMSGMGRGIMGVVTKPLGGAAELVSQTGQGLLHGAGLVEVPNSRYTAAECLRSTATNSQVKYLWKMLHTISSVEVIMSLDVTLLQASAPSVSACLLLTPTILFVINTSEDLQQQALAVSEVDCTTTPNDSSILCIVNKNSVQHKQQQDEDHNKDRVAAFIGHTSGYSPLYSPPGVTTEEDSTPASLLSKEDSAAPSAGVQYTFHVDPRFRDLFITLFRITRDKLLGVGFNI